MTKLLISAVMIGAMVAQLPAKDAGNTITLPLGVAVLVPESPNLGWWVDPPPCSGRSGRRFHSFAYACDPLYAPDKGDGDQAPSISLALPPEVASAPAVPRPERPVRPEVHEYHWESSATDSSATVFSIVCKDGRIQSANAIWVEDETLWYLAPDGARGRTPIDFIDRQATRERNAEKHLNFWLPAGD